MNNLFAGVPAALPEEQCDVLLEAPGIRLERIVSRGHVTPSGEWYDQTTNEWVLVLRGSARLLLEGDPAPILMREGDHLLIPAHRRHRVEWTDPSQPTVWLTLHYSASREDPTPSSGGS